MRGDGSGRPDDGCNHWADMFANEGAVVESVLSCINEGVWVLEEGAT